MKAVFIPAPAGRDALCIEQREIFMKILIVNDDSLYAPGIAVLAKAAVAFGDVTVVAPAQECSAMSQKLTLRETMTLEKVTDFPVPVCEAWKLGGTPVDCVKVALEYILEEKPDYVLSGINNGYNVGYDISYSGTLGAAFEAARNRIPAAAFSVTSNAHLEAAESYIPVLVEELLKTPPAEGMVWNVNFPALAKRPLAGVLRDRALAPVSLYREQYIPSHQPDGGLVLTCQGIPTPEEAIPEGTDAKAVRQGYISIGQVRCTG